MPLDENLKTLLSNNPWVSLSDTQQRYNSEAALPLLCIDSPLCQAVISVQGAQVLEFTPRNGQPLLWLSPHANFVPGTAIRGGIPVCLPWFGVNQQAPTKPKHGFARNHNWQVVAIRTVTANTSATSTNTVELHLRLDYRQPDPGLFEHRFCADLRITLGRSLQLALTITNLEQHPMPCSWALHSYHPVSDLAQAQVLGLENTRYLDNTQGLTAAQQMGPVSFNGELDRAYEQVGSTQVLVTEPRLRISGKHCDSAIVWNPGAELAKTITDIGDAYDQYVCVERGAAFGDTWELAAGESRCGEVEIESVS